MLNFTRWTMTLALLCCAGVALAQKPYRLPDLGDKFNDRIIWGSQAQSPDGFALAFGGQDQISDDGIGHTRIKEKGGEWTAINQELRKASPSKATLDEVALLQNGVGKLIPTFRHAYFEGVPERGEVDDKLIESAIAQLDHLEDRANELHRTFLRQSEQANETDRAERQRLIELAAGAELATKLANKLMKSGRLNGDPAQYLTSAKESLDKIAGVFSDELPPRSLSPIVYEPTTRTFVVFGGDHLDYLTNDLWVFDIETRRWSHRYVERAPRPRANHSLKVSGDGKIVMIGGYTYTSNTDYCGGQYIDFEDGEWVYDVEKNSWSGEGVMVDSLTRTYRTGPFHPEFYYEPKPDRKAHEKVLAALPANKWVKLDPPKLPRLNRDWGTAVLDPDRDLILRYSGGHSAHGGTDVLHYHIATNRWELCYPVEFPLGQLYANTRYPNGFNFNGRPWITGHTYQNYGYDPHLKKMLFSGREEYTYIYDVDHGDWDGRFKKPDGMIYNSCFYTLTHCATPEGLVCWTKDGQLFRFNADEMTWKPLKTEGEKLPGAVVDNSTLTYDSKRNRLLFFVKDYGEPRKYDGQIHAYDLATGKVTQLSPKGMDGADAIPYLCQIRYDEANDLLLVGGTLPPDENGLRRTPAYDPVKNEWISLKITGDDPSGERGRNVSLGMMYEPKRKLFLAVDTNSQVFVLNLEPGSADRQPLTVSALGR